jgi:hypothetical protein
MWTSPHLRDAADGPATLAGMAASNRRRRPMWPLAAARAGLSYQSRTPADDLPADLAATAGTPSSGAVP